MAVSKEGHEWGLARNFPPTSHQIHLVVEYLWSDHENHANNHLNNQWLWHCWANRKVLLYQLSECPKAVTLDCSLPHLILIIPVIGSLTWEPQEAIWRGWNWTRNLDTLTHWLTLHKSLEIDTRTLSGKTLHWLLNI